MIPKHLKKQPRPLPQSLWSLLCKHHEDDVDTFAEHRERLFLDLPEVSIEENAFTEHMKYLLSACTLADSSTEGMDYCIVDGTYLGLST